MSRAESVSPAAAPEDAPAREERVLILAPIGRDARLATETLRRAGLAAHACASLAELRGEIANGAGAVLVADEALQSAGGAAGAASDDWMGIEPPWSQLPLVVLTVDSPSGRRLGALRRLEYRRLVTFLRRPVPRLTLVSTIRAAIEDRRRQYALRDLLTELEASVRQRDEFLAALGHELRNPLGAIRNAVDLLDSRLTGGDELGRRAWNILDRQAGHLGRIVDDLLEVSRVTRGKLELRKATVELGQVCRNAVEALRPSISERRHDLTLHLPRREVWAEVDTTRFEQILSNLLGNAAKYTEPGGRIDLTLDVVGHHAEISVRDNGRGMTQDFLARAFDPFAQMESGSGGLGLGLALSRRLAELHGGWLSARSEGLGKGSELTLRIPCLEASSPSAARTPDGQSFAVARSRRVLVVEDNPDVAWGMERLLQEFGHDVRCAATGNDALAQAGDYRPEIVFLDIGLPDMSGTDVAARLRERLGGAPRIVALSGFGDDAVRQRSLDAGCDEYFAKPLPLETLHRIVDRND